MACHAPKACASASALRRDKVAASLYPAARPYDSLSSSCCSCTILCAASSLMATVLLPRVASGTSGWDNTMASAPLNARSLAAAGGSPCDSHSCSTLLSPIERSPRRAPLLASTSAAPMLALAVRHAASALKSARSHPPRIAATFDSPPAPEGKLGPASVRRLPAAWLAAQFAPVHAPPRHARAQLAVQLVRPRALSMRPLPPPPPAVFRPPDAPPVPPRSVASVRHARQMRRPRLPKPPTAVQAQTAAPPRWLWLRPRPGWPHPSLREVRMQNARPRRRAPRPAAAAHPSPPTPCRRPRSNTPAAAAPVAP
eukprot:scaffold19985_cov115-Isochrysis_galbana.AAC.5